jgi:deoxyribose-phosphate aldolase
LHSAQIDQLAAEIAEALLQELRPRPVEAPSAPVPALGPRDIARLIDHTLLRPDASAADVRRLCAEAREYGFYSVCVNPVRAALCAAELRGSPVRVCSVAGFPLGASPVGALLAEAEAALRAGASEIDMVLNVGEFKDGAYARAAAGPAALARLCRDAGALLKVILETCLLTDGEKETACRLAVDAGAHFVKTSTGFGKGGATVADVALMRRAVGPHIGVKASGGIRTLQDLLAMKEAGASRIGASASVAIVQAAGGRRG